MDGRRKEGEEGIEGPFLLHCNERCRSAGRDVYSDCASTLISLPGARVENQQIAGRRAWRYITARPPPTPRRPPKTTPAPPAPATAMGLCMPYANSLARPRIRRTRTVETPIRRTDNPLSGARSPPIAADPPVIRLIRIQPSDFRGSPILDTSPILGTSSVQSTSENCSGSVI